MHLPVGRQGMQIAEIQTPSIWTEKKGYGKIHVPSPFSVLNLSLNFSLRFRSYFVGSSFGILIE